MISAPNGSAHCRTEPLNREPGNDYFGATARYAASTLLGHRS
jgi:hypothetical protein